MVPPQSIGDFHCCKKFPDLTGGGVINGIHRNEPQAVRLVKDAVVETRPAAEFGTDNHPIAVAEWRPPKRLAWAENSHDRNVESRREMHRAAIVADGELATTENSHELSQWERNLRELAVVARSRTLSRILKPNDFNRKVSRQALRDRAKS